MDHRRQSSGQSLVEVLVAVAVGAILLLGVAAVVAPALQTGKQDEQVQAEAEVGNDLAVSVRAWTSGNWDGLLSLATGSANTYYLNTASSPFTVSTGTATSSIGGRIYTRYFYLSDVYRDSNGNATTSVSGTSYDPSTKQVNVVIAASSSSLQTAYTFYLTRSFENVFDQISWSGGSGQNNPLTIVSSSYYGSSNVAINASGSIQLATGGTTCND